MIEDQSSEFLLQNFYANALPAQKNNNFKLKNQQAKVYSKKKKFFSYYFSHMSYKNKDLLNL
jgi:hypothetical protein